MYIHKSSKFVLRGRFGVWGVFLFCLLLLSTVVQPSTAQTHPVQQVQVGVNIGDQFSFKVLYNDTGVLNLLPSLLNIAANPEAQIQDNQFQVKVTALAPNSKDECTTIHDKCIDFEPVIQLSYSSGNITNVAVEDFPAPFPNPLIVTTDWTYLAQQANYSDTNTHTLASYDRICQFRNITDSTTLVLMNLQLVFQPKYVYNHLSNYTLSTSTIYDTQTGVLDYTIWTQTNHFDNGTVSSFGYKLINMAYNGSTDVPTPSVFLTNKTSSGQIPLYSPVFLLIPIAMVRKRLKTP